MSVKLFILRGVPDDEAQEIRELLTKNEIDYYETPAGKWGISAGAIWLRDEHQLEKAHVFLEEYQRERVHRVREAYKKLQREGKTESIVDRIKQKPIQLLFYLALIVLVIYLSTKPFMDIGK